VAHPPRRRPRTGTRPLSGATDQPNREPLIPDGLDATIVLLRHGESAWITEGRFQGQGDSPLTELGLRQMAAAADRLAHPERPPTLPIPAGPPAAIVHSPLSRTATAAELVANALAADRPDALTKPRPDPGLLEIGQGEWEGLLGAEIAGRWPDILGGWRLDPLSSWAPGGESLPDVDARVRAFLGPLLVELARGRAPGTHNRSQVLGYRDAAIDIPWALLVGHDGMFKVLLLALLDLPLTRFWAFPFALGGITIVEIRGGRGRLRAHNLIDHLAELESEAARPTGAL
jgi:broad specificity phosphatase PhoE